MHMPLVATERFPQSIPQTFFPRERTQFRSISLFFNNLSGDSKAVSGFRIPRSQPSKSDLRRVAGLTGFSPYATVRVTRSSRFSVSL